MVSDGVLLIIGVNVLSAYYGNHSFYQSKISEKFDYTICNLMQAIMFVIVIANFFER